MSPYSPPEQMCKISFSPLRSSSPRKRFNGHERNQSEAIQRPRPISVASNSAMAQHAKRASIYVSDASILLQQRTPMASPVSPADSLASPTTDPSEATDHYAILELAPTATTDEIRAAYRRLRSVYFANDAKKYRALQAGFDCLMDPEARQAYNATYQPRAPAAPSSLSSIGEVLDQGKHWRKDSAHGDDAVIPEEEEEEEHEQEQEQEEDVRTNDPNWGLKRFQPAHESLLGSEPYLSFVPLPTRSLPTCRQPKYVGQYAVNSWPN